MSEKTKNLKVEDPLFDSILSRATSSSMAELTNSPGEVYGSWNIYSFKYWYDGMTKEENGSK